ncbi:restriction endonuclease subunit S [Variovorax boronicumulans]|uniref:restriction endonuclease subunit S n=1 Tax=Variovorax boronicumulans TaxID=436515 RepID=UPI003393BAB3
MRIELAELVDLCAGFPFRGSITDSPTGAVRVVQMKDIDQDTGVDWTTVARADLPGRKPPDWLRREDVLFVSRGSRFYAVCLDEPPAPAVCSPHFFHLRIKPGISVMPAFLTWQINQPPFKRQLQQAAEGSNQLSIRRPVFEALSISIPSMARQECIVALADLARHERITLNRLVRNREQQLQILAEQLDTAAATQK